jgi:S-adenosylmethionine:tRNA ribosyltransferase-isomerase
MLVSDFDFVLPPELIAQEPPMQRGASRLLRLSRTGGDIVHTTVAALPALLTPGDLLVVNNTRVFPARLLGRRTPSGGAVECLLVAKLPAREAEGADCEYWEALMHPGQKLKPGAQVVFDGPTPLRGEVIERHYYGRRVICLRTEDGSPVEAAIDRIGHMPLPPYIKRPDQPADRDRYQTVFARARGSIAAPTAGLHFTPELIAALEERGIERTEVTLHVGYGTFQPVRAEKVEEHSVAAEQFEITAQAAAAINRARAEGRRVIAVGTTTTRTLEAVAHANGGRIVPGDGSANLFIYPGFDFLVVDGLLTNFHLPRSSLLMLIAAFAGREQVLNAYREAIDAGYRFYSYGDAMLAV